MLNHSCIFAVLVWLAAAPSGCSEDGSSTCNVYACDDYCQANGWRGGICEGNNCRCVGETDALTDALQDAIPETAIDLPAETSPDLEPEMSGFEPTPGTQADVDRTEPCNEPNEWRTCPQDPSIIQACMPNYNVWAPVVCGGPHPSCACNATHCIPGEAAKPVNGGEFCICLNMCTDQGSGAVCGASNERECIPIDDYSGSQVFICGGLP